MASATLYVNNLNEKVRIKGKYANFKFKIWVSYFCIDLNKELIKLFSPFGTLLKVTTKRRLALRGQAFITYDSVQSAQKALNALQNHIFYYKEMRLAYSNLPSFVNAKAEGILEAVQEKHAQQKEERKKVKRLTKRQYRAQLWANQTILPEGMQHQQQLQEQQPTPELGSHALLGGSMPGDMSLPNKILFVQNIPLTMDPQFLESLFKSCAGFIELRLIPTKKDIAFVEFTHEGAANTARLTLDHYPAGDGQELHVSFAKK